MLTCVLCDYVLGMNLSLTRLHFLWSELLASLLNAALQSVGNAVIP